MTGNDPSDLPELPIDSRAFRDDTKSVRRRRVESRKATEGSPPRPTFGLRSFEMTPKEENHREVPRRASSSG
jgi:hypothetical protein